MARPVRVEFEDASYHVMARGNERRTVFHTPEDHILFLKTLGEMRERFGVDLMAYVLMPNHYHLLLRTPRGNLSRSMGWMQTTFTSRYNRLYRRSGHLFQGRYKAQLIQEEVYGFRLIPYVHLNPVRRKRKGKVILVGSPKELDAYPWSSHPDYAGLRKEAPVPLCWDWLSSQGGTSGQAKIAYRRNLHKTWQLGLLECPWDGLEGALVLGEEDFVNKVRKQAERRPSVWNKKWVAGITQKEASSRLKVLLGEEPDGKVRMWARVRLAGERMVDVAKEQGYKDGSGVCQTIKRLENRALKNRTLGLKMEELKEKMSSVMC